LWNDRIRLAERVESDWATLSPDERALASEAMRKLDDDPIAGVPLFEPLRGLWSYRMRWLRLVYRIAPEARSVLVLKIGRAVEP